MTYERCSDSELVSLYRQGNVDAFGVLLNRHKSRLYTSIYLIVKDRYEAEDILQEVFIKVINIMQEGRYNEEGKFQPWISRMAHNLTIDRYRQKKRHPMVVLQDGSALLQSMKFAQQPVEQGQSLREMKSRLRELIWQLPHEQRQVLIMRHYLDMSFQEIAEQMGISINTALGRMRYALIHIRKKLNKLKIHDKNISKIQTDKVPISRRTQRETKL